MTDDRNLVEALRAAGHEDVANRLRDTEMAAALRKSGHDDVADTLERKLGGQDPGAERVAGTPAEQEAQALAEAMKAAGIGQGWINGGEL